jgi:hypothetical protein
MGAKGWADMSYVEHRRFLWVLFLAGIALAAVVANSTTLARMSFDDLAQKSSAVARLRCQSSESYWDCGELWTETRFEVVERNKGLLGASITVRMLGGRADGFTSRVDGVPGFRVGEEVYLFLWGKPGEAYRVLGWSQGTFRIIHDARTGTEKIRRSLLLRILMNQRDNFTTTEFVAWRYLRFEKSCGRPSTVASR